jgi:ABC-type branched-subunit amino acid transport system ATPase component/branched-subunit amino acid ABC-type transport system permease component
VSDFLPFIVIGITSGAAYGLAATGLVLTYKTSGILNFAYGAVAALSIFFFYFLHIQHGLPWPLAAAICLFVLAPIQGLLLERLARVLDPLGSGVRVVATIGLLLVVIGVGTLWYGNSNDIFIEPYLPQGYVRILGTNVSWGQIIVIVVAVVLTAALYFFFRAVRLGIAMRGVVDNANLLSLTGESPVRVRRWAWLIGSMFTCLAGLMLAPGLSLDPLAMTLVVVSAFGAAAIGRFSSLPWSFAGGIGLGVAGALATKYVVQVPSLSGLPPSLPFAILILVLVFTPKARLMDRRMVASLPVHTPYYAPARVRWTFGAVVLVVLLFLPDLVGYHLPIWSNFLVEVILVLSLGLLVRTSGQISLSQVTFAAIGAATFGRLSPHVPWLVALLAAIIIVIPIGALLAIPAIRLSGVFLALATLGFGVFVEQMFYTSSFMFGDLTNGVAAPRPAISIGGWHLYTDQGFYYVILIAAVVTIALIMVIQRTRLGRLLRALSDSPLALEAYGTGINVTRVIVFCISAAVASLAGCLLAMLFHFSVPSNYDYFNSITLLAVVVIAVAGDPWYAIIAALGLEVIPGYWTNPDVMTWLQIAFGAFAVMYAFQANHLPTVPAAIQKFLDRLGGRTVAPAAEAALEFPRSRQAIRVLASRSTDSQRASESEGLRIEGLTVRFGGVLAVSDLSLSAPMGAITGLVGPNGAGKTTTFNACSGLVKPVAGRIFLHGQDVSRIGPAGRARRGLGRTFQKAELFGSLTVRENVTLGREARLAGANAARQLFSSPSDRRLIGTSVDDALELVGIGGLADKQAGLLPTGQKRLVELARALAGGFDLLLLDEPSSGLDMAETNKFGEIVTAVVEEWGVGVLLVEHNMNLIGSVCREVCVVDFGQMIFCGSVADMHRNEQVRAAYLGSSGTELDEAAIPAAAEG